MIPSEISERKFQVSSVMGSLAKEEKNTSFPEAAEFALRFFVIIQVTSTFKVNVFLHLQEHQENIYCIPV